MRNIFIYIALLWGISSAQAQTTKEELAEFPETMQSDMDSLYWDWQSKNFITIDENCRMLPEGPKVSDSVYIDRLSRIPSIIEMPFNDIVLLPLIVSECEVAYAMLFSPLNNINSSPFIIFSISLIRFYSKYQSLYKGIFHIFFQYRR